MRNCLTRRSAGKPREGGSPGGPPLQTEEGLDHQPNRITCVKHSSHIDNEFQFHSLGGALKKYPAPATLNYGGAVRTHPRPQVTMCFSCRGSDSEVRGYRIRYGITSVGRF